jgi:Xaa-Pro aminopeptidase
MTAYSQRISRVQMVLESEGLTAAVFAPTDQMRYLTGWAEYGHERLIALFVPVSGDPVFVVPSMHVEQAKHNPAGIQEIYGWDDAAGWQQTVADLLNGWDVNGHGVAIDDELYSAHLLGIQHIAPTSQYVTAGGLMARLREIKTAEELSLMERSAKVTDAVYEECLASLAEGVTERDVRDAIVAAYKKHGTRPAFAIVCFGENGALPHHNTGETKLKRGDVIVIDIGCLLEDYASDITRTIAFGRPEREAFKVYETVYKAHRAAFEAGKPGVTCEDVDKAARDVITDAGYGEFFIHRTGHGIGLSTHEPPYIVAGNRQELREGMCFSDEPGIYLPGRFGVRLENIVTVTREGLRSLNAEISPELLVL